MHESLKWLPDAGGTGWESLGTAMRNGLPVPSGYIVSASTPEEEIRAAYEELKIREKTHFVAVRGASHAVLNVIAPDTLVHTLRRFWAESLQAPVLVQRMIHAMWCGKAHLERKHLTIKANEGMLLLDPDTYLVDTANGESISRTLEPKQRKMIRHVDGTAKVVQRESDRAELPAGHLDKVAELAARAGADIGWAIDDLERIWLVSFEN